MPPIVTLLSDFGAGSGYPAQMKGALLSALPDARLVDLSHDVPAFDVLAGALMLEGCARAFPAAAVHLAVVDPGVGTARRPVCLVDAEGRRFVGPDNGLFTPFLEGAWRVYALTAPGIVPVPASATFHGRDLFAPVAAWLAGGGDAARLGPEVHDPVRLDWPRAARTPDGIFPSTVSPACAYSGLTPTRRASRSSRRSSVQSPARDSRADATRCTSIQPIPRP